MVRHLARFADDQFDVIVIGGGIYGLSTALALIRRRLSVALVERSDFGGATSFNSLKTVHGGIRALQHGAFREARQFVRERRAIAKLAPHLVRVLPFVVPTAIHPVRNRPAMALFLRAYDAIASDRNEEVDPALHLPCSYTVSRREALELNPLVDPRGVTGAAVWHDYQLHSPERFAVAFARTIHEQQGAVANYVEVRDLLRNHDRIIGVRATDRVSGDRFEIRGRIVVNAAGPWTWTLLERSGVPSSRDAGFSLALNLVLNHAPLPRAVGGVAGGRFVFLVPWRDRSILGTSHEGFHLDPETRPGPSNVDALLHEGRLAFPSLGLDASAIRLVHRGLLPAHARGSAHGALLKHSIVHDHRADGLSGLLSVLGVRYTTAGATAEAAADRVAEALGQRIAPPPFAPLAGHIDDLRRYRQQNPRSDRLVSRYGSLHTGLPIDALQPLGADTDVTNAEILYAVRQEMALTLADVVLRRTDLATGGHPGFHLLRAAAAVMAAECQWNEQRINDEISSVERELSL